MSLPRELLLEMLSGYMDGELSNDERKRVEQMLANDSAVRDLLDSLRQQSLLVRQAFHQPLGASTPTLGSAFADRVLEVALAASPQPVVHASREVPSKIYSPRSNRAIVAGLLAAAASIALMVVYVRSLDNDKLPNGLAKIETPAAPSDKTGSVATQSVPQDPTSTQVAANDNAVKPALQDISVPQNDAAPQDIAANALAQPQELPMAAERIAASDVDNGTGAVSDVVGVPSDLNAQMQSLRAIFVYEVYVTPQGRTSNVIERALRESNIRISNQREIDSALTSHLQQGGIIGGTSESTAAQPVALDQAVELMFLDGSGRRLEQVMLKLLAADGEISRVGFNMVMDPPVVAAVESLQSGRPEEIRSIDEVTLAEPLQPATDSSSFLASDREFLPLDAGAAGMISEMSSLSGSDQPDVPAQLLLIIRYEP